MRPRPVSPSMLWLVCGGVLGLALVVASPPFRWGDENTHFQQVLRTAQGEFAPACSTGATNGVVPAGAAELIGVFSLLHNLGKPIPWSAYRNARGFDIGWAKPVPAAIPRSPYSPAAYLPQALAVRVASVFTHSALDLLLAARVGNLLVWLLLAWAAMRLAPGFAWSFCILALSPLALFMAAACSVDAFANGIALLWVATVAHFATRQQERLSSRDLGALLALAVLLVLAKFVYASLLLTVLLVPAPRLGGQGRRLAVVFGLAVIAATVGWLWLRLAAGECTEGLAITSPAAVEAQWRTLRETPAAFWPVLRLNGAVQLQSLLPRLADTKWTTAVQPPLAGWLLGAAFALALVADAHAPKTVGLLGRIMALASVGVGFTLVVLVAFVYWTPPGSPIAQGTQTRYLLPLMPALLVAVSLPRLPLHARPARFLGIAAAALAGATVVMTIERGLAYFVAG